MSPIRLLEDEVQEPDALSFLAARMHRNGSWREDRCTGISSDALALYGVGRGSHPTGRQYPSDGSDLQACERTYVMAPDDVRARMLPVLEKYRVHVAERWAKR